MALVAVLCAIAAQPAGAARVQVAGPTAGGATLRAYHERGELCVELLIEGSHADDSCGATPRRPADSQLVDLSNDLKRGVLGGVTTPDVTRVEAVQVDGTTTDTSVAPGGSAEPGVGFFLMDYDRGTHGAVKFVRLFDAAGSELAAVSPDFFELPKGPRVAIGRVAGLRALAYDAPEFEPSPIDHEHVRHYLCVELRPEGGGGAVGRGCVSPDEAAGRPLLLDASTGTCHHGNAVFGFARTQVARMDLVLGDGSRLAAQPLTLPDGSRVMIAVAPPSMAVRRADAFDAGGRRVDRDRLGLDPPAARCANDDVVFGLLGAHAASPPRSDAPPPGGSTLAVRTDGDRLCVGIDQAAGAGHCHVPPDTAAYAEAQRDYRDGSRAFAGLVDPHVASVELLLTGGRRITVPTTPAPDAAGPYQPVSRAYLVHVDRRVLSIAYLDAAGHTLDGRAVDAGLESAETPRVVLHAGGTRLAVSHWRSPPLPRARCAELLVGAQVPDPAACLLIDRRAATAVVSCATHRIAIYGRLGKSPRGAEAITATGRRVAAAVDRASRAFLIVLRPGERLRALHVPGRHGYRAPLALPAGAQQCGYESTLFGAF